MKAVLDLKRSQLDTVAEFRDNLRINPKLRWLFFEITDICNLKCAHCGSRCTSSGTELSVSDIHRVVKEVRSSLDSDDPMICLTGGEPLMHSSFFEICNVITSYGFRFGITTNATMINKQVAKSLRKSGLSTVSVSIDGLEKSHNFLRGSSNAWEKAWHGIHCLQSEGYDVQITSVFHKNNLREIEKFSDMLVRNNIHSWRPINIEPIGRACESGSLLLNYDEIKYLLDFIKSKRFDSTYQIDITYGCSHFLGVEDERMVRNNYFICGAGIFVAGIRSNGNIVSCLDVADNAHTVQGNIYKDSFIDVWKNRFDEFRYDRTAASPVCSNCPEKYWCGGDSAHTWDFVNHVPKVCLLNKIC